jgi:hypothetical protein
LRDLVASTIMSNKQPLILLPTAIEVGVSQPSFCHPSAKIVSGTKEHYS